MRIAYKNLIKYPVSAMFALCLLSPAQKAKAQDTIPDTVKIQMPDTSAQIQDTFEYTIPYNPVDKYTTMDLPKAFRKENNPSGRISDTAIINNAPNPSFTLKGQPKFANAIVDINNKILYCYDTLGNAQEAFKVAVGKPNTPTSPGVRRLVAKLVYPYSSSPPATKRRKYPNDYGPFILYLHKVDTITGKETDDGIYIHGTRNEDAIEKGAATHGCIRLHNRDVLYLNNEFFDKNMYIKFI